MPVQSSKSASTARLSNSTTYRGGTVTSVSQFSTVRFGMPYRFANSACVSLVFLRIAFNSFIHPPFYSGIQSETSLETIYKLLSGRFDRRPVGFGFMGYIIPCPGILSCRCYLSFQLFLSMNGTLRISSSFTSSFVVN